MKSRKILSAAFFSRPTLQVAEGLVGKYLVRRLGRKTVSGMITEVEAYDGFRDMASHASRGKTPRNSIMFGPAGRWYVYLTYGMHWMLNVVTAKNGYPAAILIRAVDFVYGPGRLTKTFRIACRFNGNMVGKSSGLWIENRGTKISKKRIKRGKRIGVDYAGAWKNKLWRFYI